LGSCLIRFRIDHHFDTHAIQICIYLVYSNDLRYVTCYHLLYRYEELNDDISWLNFSRCSESVPQIHCSLNQDTDVSIECYVEPDKAVRIAYGLSLFPVYVSFIVRHSPTISRIIILRWTIRPTLWNRERRHCRLRTRRRASPIYFGSDSSVRIGILHRPAHAW